MKKVYLALVFLTFSLLSLDAQSIKCSEICVLDLAFDSVNTEIDVTVYNGPMGSQINYPVVVVTDQIGDTIANYNAQHFVWEKFFISYYIPCTCIRDSGK